MLMYQQKDMDSKGSNKSKNRNKLQDTPQFRENSKINIFISNIPTLGISTLAPWHRWE